MGEDHFEVVTIETDQPGRLINVTNTMQAAERLIGPWPTAHRGALYRKAVKACMDHLNGKKDAAAVRKAFISAAKEADIFVRDGHRYE